MPTYKPSTFIPGTSRQRKGGVRSHMLMHLRPGQTRRFLRFNEKAALARDGDPILTPHSFIRGFLKSPCLVEGTRGTSGKESEEPSARETSKSIHTFTHAAIHRCLEDRVNHLTPPLRPGTHSFGPGVMARGRPGPSGWGPLSRPRPGPRSPGRLPSTGARQCRDWRSRRRKS